MSPVVAGPLRERKSFQPFKTRWPVPGFLVVEFDRGTPDEHAALLTHLASFAPMVCTVHSGGRSLHGWFLVHGQSDEKVLRFFRYAISLGADPATWTRSQFVRMPDGLRDNGKRQTVFFLNFNSLEVHEHAR